MCLYSPSLRNENKLRTHTLPSKARYFHVTTPLLSNENEFRTHTLPSKVRYFHVTPPLSHTPTSNVRYIAFSMGTHNYHIPRNGNYSGRCLIANFAGKKCTAPCWQGVSIMKMTHNKIYPMRTNPVLTPCEQGAVHFSPRPYAQYR